MDEFVDVGAEKNHSAILHIFFHSAPESSLSFPGEFISLINHKHFEAPIALGLDVIVAGYFLNDVLDDVAVVVFVVGRGHLHVVVAAEDAEFNSYGGAFGF